MDMRIPPLRIQIMFESNPLKSTMRVGRLAIPVSEKNTPPEKRTPGKTSLRSTKSGAGQQILPLDCRAGACAKGFVQRPVGHIKGHTRLQVKRVFLSQTPVGLLQAIVQVICNIIWYDII